MHRLSVAQAAAVSLHALLPREQPTSTDEKLVVDAITALHCWAIPDKRPIPTRLRLRRSVLLRIRIRASSSAQPALISKHPERRVVKSCRHRESANAHFNKSEVGSSFPRRKQSSSNDNAAESASQPSSFTSSGSQVANLSDISTEPPEGWPKLSDISSPVLDIHPVNAETKENKHGGESAAGVQLASKKTGEQVVSIVTSPSTTRREDITPSSPVPVHTALTSPTKVPAKRRRVSPVSFHSEGGFEAEKSTEKPSASSQGSTRGTDSPSNSVDAREASGPLPNTQALGRKTKRISKRKSSVPTRRRPESTDRSAGPPLRNANEKDELKQPTSFEDSPPSSFDTGPLAQSHSAIPMTCDRATESPTTFVAHKSREQDMDHRSVDGHESANSPGSVVIGSSSYDGCSIDMGGTNRTYNDIPSHPSSSAWNGSHGESIEEPSPDDQRVPPADTIGETDDILQPEPPRLPPRLTRGQPQFKTTENQEELSAPTEKDPQEQRRESIGLLHQQTTSIVTPERLTRHSHSKTSKSTATGLALWSASKTTHSKELKPLTPSASGVVIQDHGQSNPNSNLSNGISPVSLSLAKERNPGGEIGPKIMAQRNNSNISIEANFDEMIVCIASFPKEIESELAHELVMRLGGEVVSDFDTALPHCVVAPIDLDTKEVTNSDMMVLQALASRVPVVGMSWLTHCFKSGSWVDFNNFETPSSKVKPNTGVFRGIAATFEDAFSRKNAKRKCVEYRKGVERLVTLADGVVVDTSGITEITRKDNTLRLLIRIAYDFENNAISTAPQELPDTGIPMCVVSQTWISACLFSGQCPPP